MPAFFKRIFLFFAVNILVLITFSIAFQVFAVMLGLRIDTGPAVWIGYSIIGMGGAFISLAFSRITAKWIMGVEVIDPMTTDASRRQLVTVVHTLSERAGLRKMPEVGIYNSQEINAFATGPSRSRALVAMSSGLLEQMDSDAIEGVLGHEITHIANGDMVTMTLIQGVINTMVLIVARVLSRIIASQVEERSRPMLGMLIYYLLQIVLSLFGSMIVCYFSRAREFRADAGGAKLAGNSRMIKGLERLKEIQRAYISHGEQPVDNSHPSVASLKIAGRTTSLLASLFATHPPLDERIDRLKSRI